MAIHSVTKLTTQNAEITSATVEVKALVIGKRQVTLSVFRQIPQASLFDAAGTALNGVPWGRVSYFWGDMDTALIHVLWQKGTELRRDLVGHWPESRKLDSETEKDYADDTARMIKHNALIDAILQTDQLFIAV